MNVQAYNQYRKSTVEVSPEKLLIMLYNGAIKNIKNAKKAIHEKDINQAHQQIMKAEEIIVELMSTLNMDYEISERLFLLYEYLYHRLTQANAKKDIKLLDEVEGFLLELRDTWQEAIAKVKNSSPEPANNAPAEQAKPVAAKLQSSPGKNNGPIPVQPPSGDKKPLQGINIKG